ncbi:hypothetical protein HY990_00930 [Candidatus Micrarchaeota archaeon]|nr:hypothetical protein [Candidatus Micrarchaeota archaeon]
MSKRLFFLLSLVLVLSLSYSESCIGTFHHYLPAVVGSNGGLVNMTMRLLPGNGTIYVSISPRIGTTTQDSISQAIQYAYLYSSKSRECDIIVSFDTSFPTESIDGPSAGASVSAMTFAAINNLPFRSDTIITGTIEPDGSIGLVGGMYEKALASAQMGAKYFIAPKDSFLELLLLKRIESKYPIKILTAKKISEVFGFMSLNRTIADVPDDVSNRPIPQLSQYTTYNLSSFTPVARSMINSHSQILNNFPNGPEITSIHSFYENELDREQAVLNKGYVFTAANDAFLNYIDMTTISALYDSEVSISSTKREISSCLSSSVRPAFSDSNFEWVIGSDLRRSWAGQRLAKLNVTDENRKLTDELLSDYRYLIYGKAWCNISQSMLQNAPAPSSMLNESLLRDLAYEKLALAKSFDLTNEDLKSRIDSSSSLFALGRYGASLYDSQYVISMTHATSILSNSSNVSNIFDPLLSKRNYTSLWAQIYSSQAAFLLAQKDLGSAYRIVLYADDLESLNGQMLSILKPASLSNSTSALTPASVSETPDSGSDFIFNFQLLCFIGAIIILLLFVAITFYVGKKYGNKTNSSRKVYRTPKEKV